MPKVNQDFGDTVPSKPVNVGLTSKNEISRVAGSVKQQAVQLAELAEGMQSPACICFFLYKPCKCLSVFNDQSSFYAMWSSKHCYVVLVVKLIETDLLKDPKGTLNYLRICIIIGYTN